MAAFLGSALLLGGHTALSAAPIVMPEGNVNSEQPEIPFGSKKRTRATQATFERKYQKVYSLLKRDQTLIAKIKKAAKTYQIDPVHIAGALVGEHTYNVDSLDRMQTYYVKALAYLEQDISFSYEGEGVMDFVARPEFSRCDSIKQSYALWSCREAIWDTKFRGKSVGGTSFKDEPFGRAFFQPFFAGQTFGLGQLNPLTALKLNDLVVKRSGLKRLDAGKAPEVYNAIMDPDTSLDYMAAVISNSISVYRRVANYDISGNPGITATLYNLGNVPTRARSLRAENAKLKAKGEPLKLPEENYYGWLVNEKLDDLRALF